MTKRMLVTSTLSLLIASTVLFAEDIPIPELSEWSLAGREGRIFVVDHTTLAINHDQPAGMVNIRHDVDLKPEWASLKISAKIKVTEYQQGEEVWGGVGVMVGFLDDSDEGITAALSLKEQGVTDGFVEVERILNVPAGAAKLRLEPGFYSSSGSAEISNLKVTVDE